MWNRDTTPARTFQLCKKSVVRGRGPFKKAREVQLESWGGRAWAELIAGSVPLRAWAYAWGVAWMLKEVELSKVLWRHVSVRLFLPQSPCSQTQEMVSSSAGEQ